MTNLRFMLPGRWNPYSTNYAASAQKLRDEFVIRFLEVRRDKIKAKLFAHLFDLAVGGSPDDC